MNGEDYVQCRYTWMVWLGQPPEKNSLEIDDSMLKGEIVVQTTNSKQGNEDSSEQGNTGWNC
mgnify:CR=1 FL=1